MIIFFRSSKLYIKFCFTKFYVPCLDQTVRLHIRVDMMLLLKGLWKNFSIYNYVALLEVFLKSWGILKSIGWGAQLLIDSIFHSLSSTSATAVKRDFGAVFETSVLWIFTIFKVEMIVRFKAGFPCCTWLVPLKSEHSEFQVKNMQSFFLSSWSVTELSRRFPSCRFECLSSNHCLSFDQ